MFLPFPPFPGLGIVVIELCDPELVDSVTFDPYRDEISCVLEYNEGDDCCYQSVEDMKRADSEWTFGKDTLEAVANLRKAIHAPQ